MKILMLLIILCISCAKLGYLTDQGIGQAKIQWGGRNNEELLDDPAISDEVKRKILLIGEYKKFFYYYFNEKPSKIYSKTTMLNDEAVSYLVIASPHTKIEAHEFEFPIVGSFPYLGFFNLDSAKKFAKNLEREENLITWIRPVYAYSTLGYLEDRILSSFFEYDDIELAELVFHELFHTVFFIKDEVDLNENLANLYGKQLLQEYFSGRPELQEYLQKELKKEQVSKRIVELIGILQTEFAKLGGFITNERADALTERFIMEIFAPDLRHICTKLELEASECELKSKWNQASFAAFLTYEEEQDFLYKIKKEKNFNLKEYLAWLKMEYNGFKNQKTVENFSNYLKMKVPNAPLALD